MLKRLAEDSGELTQRLQAFRALLPGQGCQFLQDRRFNG